MDPNKKKELERLIWKDRLRRILPIVGGVLALLVLFVVMPWGSWVPQGEVNATLVRERQAATEIGGLTEWVVELETGERPVVSLSAASDLEQGRHVVLRAEVHSNHGGKRYVFVRYGEQE